MTEKEHMEQWIADKTKQDNADFKGHKREVRFTNPVKYEEADQLAKLRKIENSLEKVYGPFDETAKQFIDIVVSMDFRYLLYSYLDEMTLRKRLCWETAYYQERLAEVTKERDRLKSQSDN